MCQGKWSNCGRNCNHYRGATCVQYIFLLCFLYKYIITNRIYFQVRKNLSEIIDRLLADIPALRVAVFAHVFAQYCDRTTYITKFVDFTNDAKTLKKFVNTVSKAPIKLNGLECNCLEK